MLLSSEDNLLEIFEPSGSALKSFPIGSTACSNTVSTVALTQEIHGSVLELVEKEVIRLQ